MTSLRAAYLSGSVTPKIRATLRRLRLDFGSVLYHDNDEHVIDGTNYRGDDYADPTGEQVIWGDSCVAGGSPYPKIRVIAQAAWTGSSSTTMWKSKSTSSSDDWSLSSMGSPSPYSIKGYCRVGLFTVSGSTSVYCWYVESAGNLRRSTLNTTDWTWSGTTSGLALSSHTACAIHPVSTSEAIVVACKPPYMWLKYVYWSGSAWSSTSDWVIHMSDELVLSDAHWSDAEISPTDSNKIVVALNLSAWGSAHAVIHNKANDLWSQPREILPSAEQWGNLKARVSGLSVINSRIWAVTVREPVASQDIPMAHHVALASSVDGRHWTDEYYITQSTLRGKLLYRDSESHCYVAGNASVARGTPSYRLGYDNASLKYAATEIYGLSMTASGVGSAQEVTAVASNAGEALSDSGLLETGNELAVEIGAAGYSYSDYCKALLAAPQRAEQWAGDEITLAAYGYSERLVGGGAYRPVAAKNYENPYTMHSDFNFQNGLARLTMRQVSGIWTADKTCGLGRYALHCSTAGLCLLPYKLSTPSFIARISARARVAIEGNYIVFWYRDEEDYWRAGIYRDPTGTHKLVIQHVTDSVTTKQSATTTASLDTWYTLYLEVRPGRVRIYHKNSDSYDFTSAATSISYDATAETVGPPAEHHVGLESEPFYGTEGADDWGTVDSSTYNSITDESKTFDASVKGKWLHCNDQNRQVDDYTTTKLTISLSWGEKPAVGQEWGLYSDESTNGPQFWCKELFVAEARVPWTVDDIADNMLALCGLARSAVYAGSAVGTLSSSSKIMRDVDLKVTSSATTAGDCIFWCSSYNTTGEAAYSGMQSRTTDSWTRLDAIVSDGVSGQDTILLGYHPNMVSVGGAVSKTVRVQAGKETVFVSCDGHFLTAFPVTGQHVGGYVAKTNAGDTCVTTEFPEMQDLIWDSNDPAAGALRRLMEGRRAKVLERADGSIAISRFDDAQLGDLGTYTTPITAMVTGDQGMERVALVEMCGAEERAFYLDPVSARRGLNFARADNPTLDTQEQALVEARRLAIMGRQRADAAQARLYIADPAMELEDKFTVGSQAYIVENYQLDIRLDEEGTPSADAQALGRTTPDGISSSTYGSAAYDSGDQWGG